MGITTQYLRYVPGSIFGLIGTERSIRFVTRYTQTAKYVAVPACEIVYIWDIKRAAKVMTLDAEVQARVTIIETRPPSMGCLDNTGLVVGYSDGTVAVFDLVSGQPLKFSGHRAPVSSVAWDHQGMHVASGSEDGEIVLWDVVSERGMVRLRGHKGRITRLHFLHEKNVLVSAGKDSFVKFWDLDTHHCFRTLAGHRAEVWDFVLLHKDTRLVTGSSDAELRVWSLEFVDGTEAGTTESEPHKKLLKIHDIGVFDVTGGDSGIETDSADDATNLRIRAIGSILRSRGDRVTGLVTDGRVVVCHGKSAVVDMFAILSDEDIEKRRAKRFRKAKKRARDAGNSEETVTAESQLADEIHRLPGLRVSSKISSLHSHTDRAGNVSVCVLHNNNSVAMYSCNADTKLEKGKDAVWKTEPSWMLDRPGHRSEVRAVAFNSLGDQVISASGDSLKVWNRGDSQAILTVVCDYALCITVVPGDRHALVGTKSGRLQLFDLGSSALLEDIAAHDADEGSDDSGVWGLTLTHDGRGFVTGGSDKMVKFWKFELIHDEDQGHGKRLSFLQDRRALKVADQVVCVRCSSDGKFLAVATLDQKETIFYTDTLKLCHELYGKSMPSTCMDFSTDATIIVTGSKDSSVRIYGTDFGDQRKLLKNAHQGGVTDLQFIAKTHLFFSTGHDGLVKQWDADNFQRIVTLKGHHGIVRCLAIDARGSWVVTGGQDHSIRLWERTQEPLVLEDQREEERHQQEDKEGAPGVQRPVVAGEEGGAEAVRPGTTSHLTERAADMILEALEIYREQMEAGVNAVPNQLMTLVYNTKDPLKFVLQVLRKVKSSEMEEAILILPLDQILELLVVLRGLLDRDWDSELAGRILVTALRVNLPQLVAAPKAAPILAALRQVFPQRTREMQDLIGVNLAGLRHMKDRLEKRTESQLFVESAQQVRESRKKRKKRVRAVQRALMTV